LKPHHHDGDALLIVEQCGLSNCRNFPDYASTPDDGAGLDQEHNLAQANALDMTEQWLRALRRGVRDRT
jgi:hypothetical protein